MTKLDPEGKEVISLTVSGDWGHFRRIDTTNDKQTYKIIPRTTVAGLIAAVLGLPRNSYYDIFSKENSAIAIEPKNRIRTKKIPMLTLPTKRNDTEKFGNSKVSIAGGESSMEKRQRASFEYVVDPEYRIDVVLDDEEIREDLKNKIWEGKSVYTPYLGKSECLASITPHNKGEEVVIGEEKKAEEIDSILPESKIDLVAGESYSLERTPAFMVCDKKGYRKTTDFISYGYSKDGDSLSVGETSCYELDGRNIVFI